MRRPRLRAALLAGALLAGAVPLVAGAVAPPLTCGVRQSGLWERIPVAPFKDAQGVTSPDTVTAYAVDEQAPQEVAATNGVRIQLSRTHGCSWQDAFVLSPTPTAGQPFAGVSAQVVALGLLQGHRLAAVQEGTGVASRPHVLVQQPDGTWRASDSGLPAQGAPRLLRTATDGRTAYLTISPTDSAGSDSGAPGGLVPGLPGRPAASPTGLLYRTDDAGQSWTLQTAATELPTGGAGFTALDLDAGNAGELYGIVNGRLVVSRDAGATFTTLGSGFSTVTAAAPGSLVAFRSAGGAQVSFDAGSTFSALPAPAGVTSAAYRGGDGALVIDAAGTLERYALDGRATPVPAGVSPRGDSLLGDRSQQSGFHALAGHALLRYVDPLPKGGDVPPFAVGDNSVPPPRPGVVRPAVRDVTLPVGSSALEPFELDLPKNPTPLDLYFLVDVSGSMKDYIDQLQRNIDGIVRSLAARRIDLRVGVGTIGTGPGRGERPWPAAYVYPPQADPGNPGQTRPGPAYRKPRLYQRLRAVGATGASLQATVDALQVENDPQDVGPDVPREGTLLALKAASDGLGVHTEAEDDAHLSDVYTEVPPGQDAGFRGSPDVRRVMVLATDEAFDIPYPTPERPGSTLDDPKPDFTATIAALKAARAQVIGLSAGATDSLPDLRKVALATHTVAPPGGVLCSPGDGGDAPELVRAGQPLVCASGDGFADVIVRTLSSLADRQRVNLLPVHRTAVLGALQSTDLASVDVKQATRNAFSVQVSCVGVKPGRYTQDVRAVLRQTEVGRARLNVTCVRAAAAVPSQPVAPQAVGQPPPPPAQPVGNLVPPPAGAPAAQPQLQPQLQAQVQAQPLTAGALQEQHELQLALALNAAAGEQDPAFQAGQQLAMVDRRRREQVQALGVLAVAALSCAALGLARLRSMPETGVRRAR